jgi:hypothetical protein
MRAIHASASVSCAQQKRRRTGESKTVQQFKPIYSIEQAWLIYPFQ